jgi:hypothetical protein
MVPRLPSLRTSAYDTTSDNRRAKSMKNLMSFVALMLALAAPSAAETVKASENGFEIGESVTVDAPITRVWATLLQPQKWWDREHTYSGDSANLSMDDQAPGCFCEKLPDHGSIEHMHIVYVQPPLMLRMTGALGPLQAEAVNGTLVFKLAADGAASTKVTLSYVVGGYVRVGAETLAPKVDEVLSLQMVNLKAAAEQAPRNDPSKGAGR